LVSRDYAGTPRIAEIGRLNRCITSLTPSTLLPNGLLPKDFGQLDLNPFSKMGRFPEAKRIVQIK
jgi:hypothetical protein